MAPPRKGGLPKPLPEGFTLTDTERKRWRLGKLIGQGGFGLIYLASQDVDSAVAEDTGFVIKVEYHENGPLFSELKFYQRAAKAEIIQRWTTSRNMSFLAIPTYWGAGLAEHNGLRYRFMAMDRLGSDLQKVCECNGGQLKRSTVLQMGQRMMEVLEYIHDNEYVHADIKAANIMLGYTDPEKVYLVDFGLAYRYCPGGIHKEYSENPKKGHNGTMEYTSLDAHHGVAPSRRGDLQVLGFCMLHWLCGTLPWDGLLKNPARVQEAKAKLMDNLPGSVQQLSASPAATDEVARLLQYAKSLGYKERPDYRMLRDLLSTGGQGGRLDFSRPDRCPAAGEPQDPHPRGEVGASKRRTKPKTVAVVSDEEEDRAKGEVTKSIPSRVRQGTAADSPRTEPGRSARGTSKPEAMELKKEVARKTKPIDSQYLRSPPINMPELNKTVGSLAIRSTKASGTAAVGRSARARREPIKVDEEDYESEDNDDDEWEGKATPIAACHLRGPPIGPRPEHTPARTRYAVRWQDGGGGPTEPPAEPPSEAQRHAGFHRPPYRRGWDLAAEPSPGPPTEEPSGVKVAMTPFWRDMFATCGVFTTVFLLLVCVEALW